MASAPDGGTAAEEEADGIAVAAVEPCVVVLVDATGCVDVLVDGRDDEVEEAATVVVEVVVDVRGFGGGGGGGGGLCCCCCCGGGCIRVRICDYRRSGWYFFSLSLSLTIPPGADLYLE